MSRAKTCILFHISTDRASFHFAAPVPQPLHEGRLVGIRAEEDAVAGHQDGPPVLAARGHGGDVVLLEGGARGHELAPRGGHLHAVLREQVLVVEHAGERVAAGVHLVDLPVERAGVLDGGGVVVLQERLPGEVHQEPRLDQRLPVGLVRVLHERLDPLGEPEHVDDVDVVRRQAGLRGGGKLVRLHHGDVHRHVRIGRLELLVEGGDVVHQGRVLVDQELQGHVRLAGGEDGQQSEQGECNQRPICSSFLFPPSRGAYLN